MAFTVEDGTGVTDANSWTDVAFADAYFADRAITAWTGSNSVKEAALIRAADYIHTRFGANWIFVDPDEVDPNVLYTFGGTIPVLLKKAQSEYAVRALTTVLAPDPEVDASGVQTVVIQKVLGPLEKKFQRVGNPMSAPPLLRNYPAADLLLASLVNPASGRTYR